MNVYVQIQKYEYTRILVQDVRILFTCAGTSKAMELQMHILHSAIMGNVYSKGVSPPI